MPSPTTISKRLAVIDMARGLAVLLMVIFHFCYDLNYFRLVQLDFYHSPFWLHFRTLIVSLFLLISGTSLVLATRNGFNPTHFFKRLAILALAASAITLVSYVMFPGRTIIIGILHFIAIASLLALPFLKFYKLNLVAGVTAIVMGEYVKIPAFDHPWLHWIGFVTQKPATEDYVPIFPWFGIILIGIYLGKTILGNIHLQKQLSMAPTYPLSFLFNFAGRHSLAVYLLHQPILMGTLYLATQW